MHYSDACVITTLLPVDLHQYVPQPSSIALYEEPKIASRCLARVFLRSPVMHLIRFVQHYAGGGSQPVNTKSD